MRKTWQVHSRQREQDVESQVVGKMLASSNILRKGQYDQSTKGD